MKNIKYISTSNQTAVVVEGDFIKIVVYKKKKSPYVWTKREMRHSAFGVDEKDFDYNYIRKAVDAVYTKFPYEEIDELLNKVNKYYELHTNNTNTRSDRSRI